MCRLQTLSKGESEHKAQTANQLIPTSPVAKKRGIDWPVRTESIESITDWANRTGVMRFLTNPEYRCMGKRKDLAIVSDHVTNSCLWVLWHFFPNRTQFLMFTPKLLTAALITEHILVLQSVCVCVCVCVCLCMCVSPETSYWACKLWSCWKWAERLCRVQWETGTFLP